MLRKRKAIGSAGAAEPFSGSAPRPEAPPRAGKGVWWILGGLVVAGALGWAKWLRSLPKQAAKE